MALLEPIILIVKIVLAAIVFPKAIREIRETRKALKESAAELKALRAAR